ncbi:hypothetical protein EB796_011516 [Bugula neritina]|uniref:TCTEX1D1 n=1 Tax=Bugula neritina TaxID=10212 RepID=A0A7J7JXV9_BUGNE|nr:hypothetical protein EB796_011516 [Bugula neritina]
MVSKTSSLKSVALTEPPRHNPTIFGILMTRMLAKNYVNRFRRERQHLAARHSVPPTYQLEPKKPFDVKEVERLIQKVVDMRMRTFRYQPATAALLGKILATECKDAIKSLNLDRYKVISQVFIGEKKEQSLAVSTRYVWDTKTDNTATYNWQCATHYCLAIVHGIYKE